MATKRVTFATKTGRVSFMARTKPKRRTPARKTSTIKSGMAHRSPMRGRSRSNARVQRDAERFGEALAGYVHPLAPVIIAGARLGRDLLEG